MRRDVGEIPSVSGNKQRLGEGALRTVCLAGLSLEHEPTRPPRQGSFSGWQTLFYACDDC